MRAAEASPTVTSAQRNPAMRNPSLTMTVQEGPEPCSKLGKGQSAETLSVELKIAGSGTPIFKAQAAMA